MKTLVVLAAGVMLAACSSLPSWVPGSGWTTLIDGDKGMENFSKVGDGMAERRGSSAFRTVGRCGDRRVDSARQRVGVAGTARLLRDAEGIVERLARAGPLT